MDMWPYWMFEENIKLVNEIIEEEAELSWYNVWVDSDEEDEYEEDVW